ncbi:MAG TPA: DegT/DnrJ/EryC1/StrS family aminotransferase, partial [Elusimicrobiales bacterium]|nr:DegT/DnrJ/EryC1/StrS family aminotransferase [Elusimicrobiales bacterium]
MKPIPYGCQWIDKKDVQAVCRVLRSELLTQGPVAEKLEARLCQLTGARYCVVLANGTAALHLAVAALSIGKGGEGITSANTFVASANAIAYSGLKPVLSDIDPVTFNVSPESVKAKVTKRTRVVIPVHFAGQPAPVRAIRSVVGRKVRIIEDAAHAIGSVDADGYPVGACRWSDMTVFSFHPVKTITSGEGGAITTNSRELYERLRMLRIGGITRNPKDFISPVDDPWYYEMQLLGFNYRLTDIHSALGLSQLSRLGKFIKRRREIVARYNEAFARLPYFRTPVENPRVFSAFHLYVAQIDFRALGTTRGEFVAGLAKNDVGCQVHYIPVHWHPYYARTYGYRKGDLT